MARTAAAAAARRGHINPMLVVCRLLAAADSALTITVVVKEEWHALLASAGVPPTLPERVLFATIPSILPSERDRGANHAGFIEALHTKMGEPVGRLLDLLLLEQKPPVAILADTYLARDTRLLAVDHASHLLLGALPPGPVAVDGWL